MKIDNISYCPPNITLSEIWTQNGISQCFMDTVSTSVIAGFLLISGLIQLFIYKRYATHSEDFIPKSKLYNFQIFLLSFVPLLAFTRFVLQAAFYDDTVLYGYMVRSSFFFKP